MEPRVPCRMCHGRDYWCSSAATAVWVCAVCHPPPVPELVASRFTVPDRSTDPVQAIPEDMRAKISEENRAILARLAESWVRIPEAKARPFPTEEEHEASLVDARAADARRRRKRRKPSRREPPRRPWWTG